MRFLILPTVETKIQLVQLLQPHVLDFNERDAQYLIDLWLDAEIERRSKYCRHPVSTMRLENLSYWSHLGDEIDLLLQDWLQDFVPHGTWLLFHHQAFPTYVVIEKGVDYRIADWESRIASGEWKL